MKATGIVRRIDDLGRVVIPKEIRRTMRIREGTPLEIFVHTDGSIVFKKYSPIGELSEAAGRVAACVFGDFGVPLAVCDRDRIVAAAGVPAKEIVDKPVSPQLSDLMERRAAFETMRGETVLIADGGLRTAAAAQPVFSDGDLCGMVLLVKDAEREAETSEETLRVLKFAASLLSREAGE